MPSRPTSAGAQLALSLERLEALVEPAKLQGSAVGDGASARRRGAPARGGRPLPTSSTWASAAISTWRCWCPEDELGAVCTNEQWGELYDRVAALAREHKSTLVFVNTRRLVERVTLHLGERLGAEAVAAHHGSLSRERRHRAERVGSRKVICGVVVATALLELGKPTSAPSS
jgi:ATP-dependent Lhr-like helicase